MPASPANRRRDRRIGSGHANSKADISSRKHAGRTAGGQESSSGQEAAKPVGISRTVLAGSGLFEATWYLAQNPDVAQAGMDPLDHYCGFGWREDRKPNSYFDPSWYRKEYPQLAESGLAPLLHYLHMGEHSGCRPMPLFDPVWYRSVNGLASVDNALAHFLSHRGTGQPPPCAELFAVAYIAPYRDDPESGIDPFRHYLDDMHATAQDPSPDVTIVRNSGVLDANYYLIQGSDVHAAEIDPAVHFGRYGWRERRKPNPYFDTDCTRRRQNPSVKRPDCSVVPE
jgi:hypothetical protein